MDEDMPSIGRDNEHGVRVTLSRIQPRFEPRAWLSLEGVDPKRVSEELGIESDLEVPPEILERLEEDGGVRAWQIKTHNHVHTNRLADHIDWLFQRLAGKEERFQEIASTAQDAAFRVHGPDNKWQLDLDAMRSVRERLGVNVVFEMTILHADVVHADDLTYREARASDASGIAVLLGELGYPANAREIPARLTALSKYPNVLTLVASDRGDIVGVVTAHVFPSLHAAEPVAWITSMVVSSNHQHLGIGSELVERAERWALERGAVRVSLTSALHREDAHAFYEKKQRYERTGLRFSKVLRESEPAGEVKQPPLRIV